MSEKEEKVDQINQVEQPEKVEQVEETKTETEVKPVEKSEEKNEKKSNVVSDASLLPESQDTQEILKQVEFYFSNENLPNDKFLWKTAQKNDGWVPISTIAMFSRMRRFRPVSVIVDALKESKELLEVSEDNELVRRKVPLVEPKKEEKQEAFIRTIYAKGFGEETPTSQFDIEKFFEQFGPVKQVRLRRSEDKKFKSSVFAEFAELEDAQKFLALDPKPKYDGQPEDLLTMSKQAYVEMKAEEYKFAANANGKHRKFNAFRESQAGNNSQKRKSNDNHRNHQQGDKRRRNNFKNNRNQEREKKDAE